MEGCVANRAQLLMLRRAKVPRGASSKNKNAGLVGPAFSLSFIRRKRLVSSFPRISIVCHRSAVHQPPNLLHHERETLEFLL